MKQTTRLHIRKKKDCNKWMTAQRMWEIEVEKRKRAEWEKTPEGKASVEASNQSHKKALEEEQKKIKKDSEVVHTFWSWFKEDRDD